MKRRSRSRSKKAGSYKTLDKQKFAVTHLVSHRTIKERTTKQKFLAKASVTARERRYDYKG